MRVDVPRPDAWGRISETYRAGLGRCADALKDPALNVQIYAGVGHAVGEISKALAKLFTHKKTIAIVQGTDPAFTPVAMQFSEEGYVVKTISPDDAVKPETWAPLMDELLFVLTCDDDPVTGRLYPFDAVGFGSKRVFRIHVKHESHRWAPMERPTPFVVQIWSLAPDRALIIAGERCRIEPQLAPQFHWAQESAADIDARFATVPTEQAKAREASVKAFEAALPAGFKAYFKPDEPRLFDRTVIYHEDYDGSAVIDELASTMQLKLAPPGERSPLESTSACRWESPRFYDWLLARGETDATARGLVIVSSDLIERGLATHLATAAAKLARLQNA